MTNKVSRQIEEHGSSPASRGGAGTYIEGELGAFYLLAMLAHIPAHGLPNAQIVRVRFQGTDLNYKLDDLIIHGASPSGDALLEIQSKRDITFAPKDTVYREVAEQIALSHSTEVAEERHFVGIATQRTSRNISGAYQDVLKWAAAAETCDQFYKRLNAKGVASKVMRDFELTTRNNLVAGGVADDDEAIWRILRRLLILEFDFESSVSLARTHGQMLARQMLADEDVGQADALWRTLIELSIATGTIGGSIDRQELKRKLVEIEFRLAGDRDYGPARIKIAEMAQMTLASIGSTVTGVNLPRFEAVAALDEAAGSHRFIEVRGGPGVGKSWVLRNMAERVARKSPIIVLDPVATPSGGWIAFAQALGISGTASDFLSDLAASGGAMIFIDSLDMFTDPGHQRTVVDLLRAASTIPGFTVIVTTRTPSNPDSEPWLDDTITAEFGGVHPVLVSELTEADVAILVGQAPELKALLDKGHPASKIARNLYRLSRLVKVPSATEIRTEAILAHYWWKSADGAAPADVRPAQRILADLAARSFRNESGVELRSDSSARSHLLDTLTLKELRRDQLDFYHDVLRDWAIGNYIFEDPSRLNALDLSVPASPRVARGIEFAGRLALELEADSSAWGDLLNRLSTENAHSTWRRQATLAMTRSEAGPELLEKCSSALLAQDGALFIQLSTTIAAVETVATVDVMKMPDGSKVDLSRSHRFDTTGSAIWVLHWVLNNADEIPLQAISAVVELVEIQVYLLKVTAPLAKPVVTMLFGWLRQLDVGDAAITIPVDKTAGPWDRGANSRMVEKLRTMALLLGEFAPEQLKAYLTEVAAEHDSYKVKGIRPFSQVIAPVAPAELSSLILNSLIEKRDQRRPHSFAANRAFTFADSDFMPPSPAQPPFLDLLEAAPDVGLNLIRTLVTEALAHHVGGHEPDDDGFTLVFDEGPRLFPWTDTYLWSRDQAPEYSVASGLKALEAWSHKRLDDGEAIEAVLADILVPKGCCAAFLLVAIDVLLSHFSQGRDELGPFIACPELLASDRMRANHDQMAYDRGVFGQDEPSGKVMLADLRSRQSRQVSLSDALQNYLGDDPVARTVRARLGAAVDKLEPYETHSDWVDPRFIGRYARNVLDFDNWTDIGDGKSAYQSPPDESAHLEQMGRRYDESVSSSEAEARIRLAVKGGNYAIAETARIALDYAGGGLPDASDTDVLKSRSTRLITTAMLVTRNGDDALLDEHTSWVRQVIDLGLAEKLNRHAGSGDNLQFNRPALAALALIHLWRRKGSKTDQETLMGLATRRDRIAAPAFAAALPEILETEPKLLKAAMRVAFSTCLWRWHSYDEDEAEKKRFVAEQEVSAQAAVAAEIAWLEGGKEPAWPEWPKECPTLRRRSNIRVPGPTTTEDFDADERETDECSKNPVNVHIDSSAAAQWLRMVNVSPHTTVNWGHEIIEIYSGWTSRMNGLDLPTDEEIDQEPADWNHQYYLLFARQLMETPANNFETDLQLITRLPDKSFGAVAQIIIQAIDAIYFNDPNHPADRPVELRTRFTDRVIALQRWKYPQDPDSMSVDWDTAGIVAQMLLNTHNPFNMTKSYLPEALSERLDPLLNTIRPLLPGGPTSFVALCTMNLLLVTPRARHLNFLLDAAEAWNERTQSATFWTTAGIGRRIVDWFNMAMTEQPTLLGPAHPARSRIDHVIGRLVSVGVAEAHEIEKKVEAAASVV